MKQYGEWFPEDDDMLDDYYHGMIATLSCNMELSDEQMSILEDYVPESEYVESGNLYSSILINKVSVDIVDFDYEEGDDKYCTITIECAVDSPEMPIDAIEDEVTDGLHTWLFDKIEDTPYKWDWEDERVVYDYRSEKYK